MRVPTDALRLLLLAALALTGCGGGGGDEVAPVAGPPAAPSVSLAFAPKELRFTWGAVGGADFFRISENPDGVSGYTQVATNIVALSYNHIIPVHRRLNASYIVEACNGHGCTASSAQALGANLTQAIGYVKASNTGASDWFGVSIALSADGSTLAVGAPNEDSSTTGINSTPDELADGAGAVYVYARTAGAWSQQAYIKAANAEGSDLFGQSVALSATGNTLAVGAVFEGGSGAAYVFVRSAGAWSQQALVKASNPGNNDNFGFAIALSGDGDTLAVGAILEDSSTNGINNPPDNLASNSGAVYVFIRGAGIWSQQAFVKASNTGANDQFGTAVALSGDGNTLAVGATEDSSTTVINGPPDELAPAAGAVYVFVRNSGTWSQQAFVKGSNTAAGDFFGSSIALSGDGDTLAVGAFGEDGSATGVNGTPDEAAASAGAVYVFVRSGTTWSQQAYVKSSNTGANDFFGGVALSADGNTLAVGATGEASGTAGIGSTPDEAALDSGAAYVFVRNAGTWSQQAYVKASNTGAGDQFGYWVAISGDGGTLAVGAPFESGSSTGIGGAPNEGATSAGAVYLY